MLDYSKIKLVIWDLDDTFWKGTLSEGPIVSIAENIQLVRDLTDRGIVNSICSKNDYEPTVQMTCLCSSLQTGLQKAKELAS